MAILLQHPQHGRHFAYDDAEMAKLAAAGWQPVGAAPASPAGSFASVSSPPDGAAPSVVKRKPGRPRKVPA